MAQVSMTVELEAAARASFEALCKDFGMSVNTAFRLFVNAVINQRRIPLMHIRNLVATIVYITDYL